MAGDWPRVSAHNIHQAMEYATLGCQPRRSPATTFVPLCWLGPRCELCSSHLAPAGTCKLQCVVHLQAAVCTTVLAPASCSVSCLCKLQMVLQMGFIFPTRHPAELFVTLSYCLHVRLLAIRMRACCWGGRGPRHWVSRYGLTRRPSACSERAQCLGIYLPLALSEYFPIAIPTLRCNVILC